MLSQPCSYESLSGSNGKDAIDSLRGDSDTPADTLDYGIPVLPHFDRDEIFTGELLGKGAFNDVYEVHSIGLIGNIQKKCTEPQQMCRRKMANQCSKKKFAIKSLKSEEQRDGAADLIFEACVLAMIKPHPNIVKLHGYSADVASGVVKGPARECFLILDRLSDTLSHREQEWRQKGAPPLSERLSIALQLSNALSHIHSYNVIFRDLKPDNIGFDSEGTLQLFDFGLAKEIDPSQRISVDSYLMSGQTGSRRYMAPEVALNQGYGLSADVYSFGLILWMVCSLEEPYAGMSIEEHLDVVVKGSERPNINLAWPHKISNIMKWCWSVNQLGRPSMKDTAGALQRQLDALRREQLKKGQNSPGLQLSRASIPPRRSTSARLWTKGSTEMPQLDHEEKAQQQDALRRDLLRKGQSSPGLQLSQASRIPPRRSISTRWWTKGSAVMPKFSRRSPLSDLDSPTTGSSHARKGFSWSQPRRSSAT